MPAKTELPTATSAQERSHRASKRRKLSPPPTEEGSSPAKTRANPRQARSNGSLSKSSESGAQRGLGGVTELSDKKDLDVARDGMDAELPSLKGMDSSDPSIRRRTLTSIVTHLEQRSASIPLTSTQCLQLWRGFHVALYMHDSKNAISVQNLITQLASTVSLIGDKDEIATSQLDATAEQGWTATYTSAFWETMAREWSSIDSHRMNKYLLLIRMMVREIFALGFRMSVSGSSPRGDNEILATQMQIVERLPLNGRERKVSDGLRLHVLDLWTDEVFNAWDAQQQPADELSGLLDLLKRPLETISKGDSGAQRHVRMKAKEALKEMDERMQSEKESVGAE